MTTKVTKEQFFAVLEFISGFGVIENLSNKSLQRELWEEYVQQLSKSKDKK